VKPLYLHKRTSIRTEYEAGWNPENICLFWRRENSLAPVGICVNNSDLALCSSRATQARQVSTEEPDEVSHSDRE
jgi:hypothetical protein